MYLSLGGQSDVYVVVWWVRNTSGLHLIEWQIGLPSPSIAGQSYAHSLGYILWGAPCPVGLSL